MISHELRTTSAGNSAVLIDSISFLTAADDGKIVVCASHGGASSGEYAGGYRPGLVIFNDAGVGKDGAGIAALGVLAAQGVPACTVSHDSARIGDVADTWANGVLSQVNSVAVPVLAPGVSVEEAVDAWAEHLLTVADNSGPHEGDALSRQVGPDAC